MAPSGTLASTTVDALEWARFIATIITPVAVTILGFWLGARAQSRKKIIEDINFKIDDIRRDVNAGREECREDIRAVTVQVSSFQRDVAERYPQRGEIETRLKELREEIQYWRTRT